MQWVPIGVHPLHGGVNGLDTGSTRRVRLECRTPAGISPPLFPNSCAFSRSPCAIAAVSSAMPCVPAAYSRMYCVIFSEQKCGPHGEQKWASLAPAAGGGVSA